MALENFPVHSCLKLPPNGHAGAAGDHRPQLPLASGVFFQDRSSVSGTSLVRPEPGFGVENTITSGPVSLGGWQETGGWGSSSACGWEAPPSSDPQSSSGWGTHAAHMTSPSRHGPGTSASPSRATLHPLGPRLLLAQPGPPWRQAAASANGLQKGEGEKTARTTRAQPPGPRCPRGSDRRWAREAT